MTNAHCIPFRKSDIIAMCLQDSDFDPEHKEAFSDCCKLLQSIIHVEFHRRLERLKDRYAPVNPGASAILRHRWNPFFRHGGRVA